MLNEIGANARSWEKKEVARGGRRRGAAAGNGAGNGEQRRSVLFQRRLPFRQGHLPVAPPVEATAVAAVASTEAVPRGVRRVPEAGEDDRGRYDHEVVVQPQWDGGLGSSGIAPRS